MLSWRRSRFNAVAPLRGGGVAIHNTLTGAFAKIPASASREYVEVVVALEAGISGMPRGILADLCLNGFFVLEGKDEIAEVRSLCASERDAAADRLELILMPTEQCNFRCVYCAQTFQKGKMTREVIEGVVRHVARRAPELRTFQLGWFGGEPLVAREIIDEVAGRLRAICSEYGVLFTSGMTTNGYLLTQDTFAMLMRNEVRTFQITLDGSPQHHDRLRKLGDRKRGTFDRILTNLRAMKRSQEYFKVVLRTNFDRESADQMRPFIDLVAQEFGGDERFCVDFHPVGRWGGPNDAGLNVCDAGHEDRLGFDLAKQAISRGVDSFGVRGKLRPGGSKCYAGRPFSFVIGSDGTVYKCTVAFDDPVNHVGRIDRDGELNLDMTKYEAWVGSGADVDTGCQSCFFSPSCQGNACPLERMRTGQRPCPSIKRNIGAALEALA